MTGMIKGFTSLGLLLMLAGCTSLKSSHHVGKIDELNEWDTSKETIWDHDGDVYHVRVPEPGKVIASTLVWEDSKQAYRVKTHQALLTGLGKMKFLNIKKEGDSHYTIVRVAGAPADQLVIFTVDDDVIKRHISEGKLAAEQKGSDFIVTTSKAAFDDYMLKYANELFSYDAAGIIRPLKRFEKKDKK